MSIDRDLAIVGHLIAGKEVFSASGRTFASHNPATGAEIASVAFAGPEEVDRAVASGRHAFETGVWSRVAPRERSRVLHDLARLVRRDRDKLAATESRDTGKPMRDATDQVDAGADLIDFFAGLAEMPDGRTHPVEAGYFAYTHREPYGVVGAIAPWNYPFLLACQKTAPALAAGNSVVLKAASETPLSTASLGRLGVEAGLPDGVLNLVHGDGRTTGSALVTHPSVPKLTFTGSTSVGQEILRVSAEQMKSVHLEVGGKSANIILADADAEQAVAGSLFTAFVNSGQICTSGSRLLVDRRIADQVVAALCERLRTLQIGDPADPATKLGPLVSREQQARVLGYVAEGRRSGATVAFEAILPDLPPGGFFVPPTVFVDVDPDMRIAREEIFGPVLSVLVFDTEEEALRIANDSMYGLAATVWTRDLGRAFHMADRLEAGVIWTNCPHYLPANVPYEGHKMSGLGEDLGVEAMNTFTHLKTHVINHGGARTTWA